MVERDIYDPSELSNIQEPFAFAARLRSEHPVYWNERHSFWMLTRYNDVKAALQSASRFSSVTEVTLERGAETLPQCARSNFEIGKRFFHGHMQAMDDPHHAVQRSAVAKAMMPLVSEAAATSIESRIDTLLDKMEQVGSCDFATHFAHALPALVVFDLLGVETEHHRAIQEAAAVFWTFPRAVYTADVEALERIAQKLTLVEEILLNLIQRRRANPEKDIISALACLDGALTKVPDAEIVVLCVLLLMAGHETTANLLSGSLRYLLQDRAQWDILVNTRELSSAVVEELLRFISPVLWVSRVLTDDVDIDDYTLLKGSAIRLGIGSANHDPSQFNNPDQLDVARPNPYSLAFGHGLHYCLGAALARIETKLSLSKLIQRFPDIQLSQGEFEYHPVFFMRALKSLLVTVRKG
jgi:cytochrome P450